MNHRKVILEFCRIPNQITIEGDRTTKIWFFKGTTLVKCKLVTNKEYFSEKYYDIDGFLHRDDDLPAIIDSFGESHYLHGSRHRGLFKPAVIEKKYKAYYVFGEKRFETKT